MPSIHAKNQPWMESLEKLKGVFARKSKYGPAPEFDPAAVFKKDWDALEAQEQENLAKFIETLRTSLLSEFVPFDQTDLKNLKELANQFEISDASKSGHGIFKHKASGSLISVTPEKISLDKGKLTLQAAMAMASIAARDKSMRDDGVTLTGSAEEKILLQYALQQTDSSIKIHNPVEISDELKAQLDAKLKGEPAQAATQSPTNSPPIEQKLHPDKINSATKAAPIIGGMEVVQATSGPQAPAPAA